MAAAPDRDEWNPVQDVIGPLEGGATADALYATGARSGEVGPTPSGRRHRLVVPAGDRVSFGAYFNAFPAAVWRASTRATRVRLELRLDGPASVVLVRSDAAGRRAAETEHVVGEDGALDAVVELGGSDGGFVWFEVAADRDTAVTSGTWSVDAPPLRGGRAVLGMPTVDRGSFVAANLRRIATAPELLRRVVRMVVVDQGTVPAADDPAVAAAAADLGDALRVIRQPNLGGSGGYSRILLEATEEPGADVVVFLDDDIEVEPASLLRSLAFGRTTTAPTVVGGQMLDLGAPEVVQAAAERVSPGSFWWVAADERTSSHDHGALPLPEAPWVHERRDADYNGWWMCQFPLETVERLGFVLPLFLKWDDVEYSLRAARIGVPTVSLPGAAVWHVAFRAKDDSIEWQAFFHARNRVVVAMLEHASPLRVLAYGFALDVKQLLAKQYPAARLRHAGMRAALDGPAGLERRDDLARARAIAAAEPSLPRRPLAEGDRARALRPRVTAPEGAALATWAVRTALRQLLTGPAGPLVRVPRADWWVLARFGRVLAPTADGAALLLFATDRRALLDGLVESFALHLRLLLRWRPTAARYRAAAQDLASPEAWRRRFTT